MRVSVSEPPHKNRLDSVRQCPRRRRHRFGFRAEVKFGDRWAGLVVFWTTVTIPLRTKVPEPRQPRRQDDCTEEAHGALHTHRVCSPMRAAHVFPHTLMTQLRCWTKSCSRRVVRRGHTIGPLRVSLGTAELKISGLMLFNTPRRIVTASVTCCSSYGECRRCGATCLSSSCVVCHLLVTELL